MQTIGQAWWKTLELQMSKINKILVFVKHPVLGI